MTDFMIAYKKTAAVEGGYANHPADKGGETWKGIARNMHPDLEGWKTVDKRKNEPGFPKNLNSDLALQGQVMAFFKQWFWDSLRLGDLQDQQVANELYDTGVNMGTGRASLFFQRVLNAINKNGVLYADLALDGKIGGKTVAAFNALSKNDKAIVWRLLNCLQGEKYFSICEANPAQKVFFRSWASRVFEAS